MNGRGWWTSGRYISSADEFLWTSSNTQLSPYNSNWGSRSHPYDDTCVLLLSNTAYAYTLSNQSCDEETGFICEIQLPQP